MIILREWGMKDWTADKELDLARMVRQGIVEFNPYISFVRNGKYLGYLQFPRGLEELWTIEQTYPAIASTVALKPDQMFIMADAFYKSITPDELNVYHRGDLAIDPTAKDSLILVEIRPDLIQVYFQPYIITDSQILDFQEVAVLNEEMDGAFHAYAQLLQKLLTERENAFPETDDFLMERGAAMSLETNYKEWVLLARQSTLEESGIDTSGFSTELSEEDG